jgi:cardiolipin synthase
MTEASADKVTVVVTGLAWMGRGIRSIDSTIEEMLSSATDEIQIAAYVVTSGAEGFVRLVSNCLTRGVKVTLVVNRFGKQPRKMQNMIMDLLHQFPHFSLFQFSPRAINEDLHAKIIVVDRTKALIGSSNLSWKGLILNHEIAVIVDGPSAARISSLVDMLCRDKRTKAIKPF